MKRKTETPIVFTLRDTTGGELIHAARVAAAKLDMSINTWLLKLIDDATREDGGK
jgi:predicted HicB family RNase H-like nuclease